MRRAAPDRSKRELFEGVFSLTTSTDPSAYCASRETTASHHSAKLPGNPTEKKIMLLTGPLLSRVSSTQRPSQMSSFQLD
jgi:hypothetical protein